jgi:hypothetical protein
MSALDTLIFGYRTILAAAVAVTQRNKVNFLAPLTATDNAGTGSTDIGLSSTPTIATPTFTGTITSSGTGWRILDSVDRITTTDATVTTVASWFLVDETAVAIDVLVLGSKRTSVTEVGRYKRSVVYRRTAAGVATIVGTLESGTDQETSAGLDVTIDTDGAATVRVRVTGLAATNMTWSCAMRVQENAAT